MPTIKIPGMSHPRYQYVAGEPRRIAFKVELFKGPVKQKVDWLRSLQYPEHAGTMLKNAPHRVLLIFGDLYPGRDLHRPAGQGAVFRPVRPGQPAAAAGRGGYRPRGIRRPIRQLVAGALMIGRDSRYAGCILYREATANLSAAPAHRHHPQIRRPPAHRGRGRPHGSYRPPLSGRCPALVDHLRLQRHLLSRWNLSPGPALRIPSREHVRCACSTEAFRHFAMPSGK